MNWKTIVVFGLGLVFLVSFLVCGHHVARAVRRIRLQRAAMAAYEAKDYEQAERLLLQYVQKNPESEEEFVALANIYHEFGNAEAEAQMWLKANSLDTRNPEYRSKMLTSAVKSANYSLLHGILSQKIRVDEKLTDQELSLAVISSYRSGYPKDGDSTYKKYVDRDPEAFHKDDLGRMAEFMAIYETRSEGERTVFLQECRKSEDPVVRFEALYFAIRRAKQLDDDNAGNEEEMENLLKEIVEVNYFAGTPLQADYYFFKYRFDDLITVLEPYLKTIDDMELYLLYAESCFFTGKLEKLKELEKKLRQKIGPLSVLADYCEILVAYLEKDEKKLIASVRQSGRLADSPLAKFIRLRVAMANGSFDEIQGVAQEIFSSEPFYDLHNRALFICLDYISREMKKPENRKDPSRMANLAKILSAYLHENRLLTEIILSDQFERDLANESDLMDALELFPDDTILRRITAKFLIAEGKSDQALPLIEQVLDVEKAAGREPDRGILLLNMLALDQLGERDEAAASFRELVEKSGFDMDLLNMYFQYCIKNRREEDLSVMGDLLDALKDEKRKPHANFFRAAALLMHGEERTDEALDLLASTPADNAEFTFYAANRLCEHGRLDEAETKYKAILKTYRIPALPYVNLSNVYHAKGDEQKALEAAKEAFTLEKESKYPAFVYAQRLAEAGRYEEAVDVLKFPRHAVKYREDMIELWSSCMKHVIEKTMELRKFLQAEEQCKHLLLIVPDDEFAKKKLEQIHEILFPKKDGDAKEDAAPPA